jgi:hypothetical protein
VPLFRNIGLETSPQNVPTEEHKELVFATIPSARSKSTKALRKWHDRLYPNQWQRLNVALEALLGEGRIEYGTESVEPTYGAAGMFHPKDRFFRTGARFKKKFRPGVPGGPRFQGDSVGFHREGGY